jgi:hypothetical protein
MAEARKTTDDFENMKTKPIIADPLNLDHAGITTCRLAATFIHVGRCGLVGTTIPRMTRDIKVNPSTLCDHINTLQELGLVVAFSKSNSKSTVRHYCVTIKGWSVLTAQADFSMFQGAMEVTA